MASFLLKTFDQCVIMSRKQVTGKILRKFVYLLKKNDEKYLLLLWRNINM